MNNIDIYTKPLCPYCHKAKRLLDSAGLAYREIDVSTDASLHAEMLERSQRHTVPQIFIGDHHVGGSDDLQQAEQNGELTQLLNTLSKAS